MRNDPQLNGKLPKQKTVSGTTTSSGNLVIDMIPSQYTVIAAETKGSVTIPYIASDLNSWALNVRSSAYFDAVASKAVTAKITYVEL